MLCDDKICAELNPSHGNVSAQFAAGGCRFTLAQYSAKCSLPPHVHAFPGIVMVVSGLVEESFASGSIVGTAGSLLVRRHNQRHADRFGSNGATLIIVENLDGSPDLSDISNRPAVLEAPFIRMLGFSLLDALKNRDDESDIAFTSHAVDLWKVGTAPRRKSSPPRVARAVELIHDDIGAVRRIDKLAQQVDVHAVSLARGFREQYGCSLATYVLRVRVDRANELVRDTRKTLAQIAAEAGFADQAHMTRCFRTRYGRTPGAIRSQI